VLGSRAFTIFAGATDLIASNVARRYARALLSLGVEEGRFEQYGEELEAVLAAMKQTRELAFVLVNPGYAQQQRHAAVDAAASALKLSAVTVNFLRLLVDRQRVGALADVARVYRALVDRQAGRIRATVVSAGPLSGHELERLREAIARTTGRAVVLESKTDSSLIGGVVAQVGPTMLDGSLRTQLERMRHELKRAPL
jgi:F-type H+-transporting ATPase subunit delta